MFAEEIEMRIDESLSKCVEELHQKFSETDLDAERKKIDAKLEEAKYSPGDIRPLADCVIALLLVARSRGYAVDDFMEVLQRVARENTGRNWKKMPDGTYQAS
jgi:hypothetical protein